LPRRWLRLFTLLGLFGVSLAAAACEVAGLQPGSAVMPAEIQPVMSAESLPVTPPPSPLLLVTTTPPPPLPTPRPTRLPLPMLQPSPNDPRQPTLADFWVGRAHFMVDTPNTRLPMGESDTMVMSNGELWTYLHASQRSAGVVDRCGAPVDFPGCTVIYRSYDGGRVFSSSHPPVCQFACNQCPCTNELDQIGQQQYPRVFFDGQRLSVVYEYLGRVMLRRSADGLNWSAPEHIDGTTIWNLWYRDCPQEERIGAHPFAPYTYDCLAGGPPGLYVADGNLYVFLAQGQNPGAMGCYVAPVTASGEDFRPCQSNPLFAGASDYGPLDTAGPAADVYFDFRTVSSADVQKLGDGADARYYMVYEGVRGPGPGDAGDTQFGLGLARSLTDRIDGAWEKHPGNPILNNLPGNIGIGHADLVVSHGRTYLYTSLDGIKRSRLLLVWNPE
jgi:hypothetical protein